MKSHHAVFPVAFVALFVFSTPQGLVADTSCEDSTRVAVPLFQWDHPGDASGIAVGTNGFVYLADGDNFQICRYSLYGGGMTCWSTPSPIGEPQWVAWNPVTNRLYVSENNRARVLVFNASGTLAFTIQNTPLSTDPGKFAGNTGPIAIDPVTGNLWVYDAGTINSVTVNRFQEFNQSGVFTGRVINHGGNPTPTCGSWEAAEDVMVDSTGAVYVLDCQTSPSRGAVHRIVPGSGCVSYWGHQPGPGFLYFPHDMSYDSDGFIYVLDWPQTGGVKVFKYGRAGNYVTEINVDATSGFWSLDFLRGESVSFFYTGQLLFPATIRAFGDGIEARNILETQWVDENSFQLKTDDLQLLAECPNDSTDKRIKMEGVAADGVSPLLLRLRLPESGTVRWKLADPDHPSVSEGLGTLTTLDSVATGATVDAQVDTVGEERIAFAIYTAPIDFERTAVPGDASVGERPLRVTAEFNPMSSADSIAITEDLRIERPTVFFLHGFLEHSSNWDEFQSIVGETALWGKRTYVAEYFESSGDSLIRNVPELVDWLNSRISSARDSAHIAAAQVDIVAHSMGGLVLRRLADATVQDNFSFRNANNMGQGYYHKALFLNVPHQGSVLANITSTIRGIMNNTLQPLGKRLAAQSALWLAATIYYHADFNQLIGGAIDDMSLGSDAVMDLQPFTVPSHAHVGTGGSDLWFTPQLLKAAGKLATVAYIGLVTSLTNLPELLLLGTEDNDIAVLLDSQVGGLTNPNHYITANFEDGLHESSFFSSISGNRARDWATRSVADASFFASTLPGGSSLVPPPATTKRLDDITQALQNEMPDFAGVTVRIANPGLFSVVISGDSFLVNVEPYSDVSTVVVGYPGGAVFMDSTLTGYAHTDVAFNGPFELSALALMADGTMGRSESMTITVRPPSSVMLDGIEVDPSSVSLSGIGSVLELRVVGNYSGGVQRDVASAASGTVYSGFNPGIVTVSPDGALRGSGPGITTLTVQKSAFTQVVKVEVGDAPPINNRPHALAGGPYQICNGDGVSLDASNSLDLDGDPLTFEWELNGNGLFDDAVGSTVTYSPPYIVDSRLVGLRVRDASGATSEDYTTIEVPLNCFQGQRICAAGVSALEASDLGVDGVGDLYIFHNLGPSGHIVKRNGTCAFGASGFTIFDPEDLDELAVDSAGVAYVVGDPSEERILLFGPGTFSELEPLIPVFTTPYSLVTGIAVDRNGNLYGSDYDAGAQHVFLRKFYQATP